MLHNIQTQLKANKSQYNNFGKYAYRNAEDVLEALKPLLSKHQYSVIIKDDIEQVGNKLFVRATVNLFDEKMQLIATTQAYAEHPESLKGMSPMQVTGATSSYAKKYALGSMFLLDDSKDSDSQDNSNHVPEVKKEVVSEAQLKKINTLISLKKADREGLKVHYKVESLKDLPLNAVQGLIEYLEKL